MPGSTVLSLHIPLVQNQLLGIHMKAGTIDILARPTPQTGKPLDKCLMSGWHSMYNFKLATSFIELYNTAMSVDSDHTSEVYRTDITPEMVIVCLTPLKLPQPIFEALLASVPGGGHSGGSLGESVLSTLVFSDLELDFPDRRMLFAVYGYDVIRAITRSIRDQRFRLDSETHLREIDDYMRKGGPDASWDPYRSDHHLAYYGETYADLLAEREECRAWIEKSYEELAIAMQPT